MNVASKTIQAVLKIIKAVYPMQLAVSMIVLSEWKLN